MVFFMRTCVCDMVIWGHQSTAHLPFKWSYLDWLYIQWPCFLLRLDPEVREMGCTAAIKLIACVCIWWTSDLLSAQCQLFSFTSFLEMFFYMLTSVCTQKLLFKVVMMVVKQKVWKREHYTEMAKNGQWHPFFDVKSECCTVCLAASVVKYLED